MNNQDHAFASRIVTREPCHEEEVDPSRTTCSGWWRNKVNVHPRVWLDVHLYFYFSPIFIVAPSSNPPLRDYGVELQREKSLTVHSCTPYTRFVESSGRSYTLAPGRQGLEGYDHLIRDILRACTVRL